MLHKDFHILLQLLLGDLRCPQKGHSHCLGTPTRQASKLNLRIELLAPGSVLVSFSDGKQCPAANLIRTDTVPDLCLELKSSPFAPPPNPQLWLSSSSCPWGLPSALSGAPRGPGAHPTSVPCCTRFCDLWKAVLESGEPGK